MSNPMQPLEQRKRILLVHNSYQQHGGEDAVFDAERELLSARGHQVFVYKRHNDEIKQYGLIEKASLSLRTLWAWDSRAEMRELIRQVQPDVAHFHNTFPLISPAAYYACRDAEIPVVQSLHNARLICPAATFHREGKVCVDCLGKKIAWPGIFHGCYHESRIETGIVAGMLAFHSYLKTWDRLVDTYVVFSDFYRRTFVNAGFPVEKITVKPHFVAPDPGQRQLSRDYALFVGRLAPEKGVLTLLEAWNRMKAVPLKVCGQGSLMPQLNSVLNVELLGHRYGQELRELFQGARFLVWPSEGYNETFGLVAIEAFAYGIPVIASRIGVMAEIVRHGSTGLHFNPGDPNDLAAKVEWAWANPKEMTLMGDTARAEYEQKYTAERNYELLMNIYRQAARTRVFASGALNERAPVRRPAPLESSR
jgi:glycosyltransferase involved in cell wall biosynthesis